MANETLSTGMKDKNGVDVRRHHYLRDGDNHWFYVTGCDTSNKPGHVWTQTVDMWPMSHWFLYEVDPSKCEIFDTQTASGLIGSISRDDGWKDKNGVDVRPHHFLLDKHERVLYVVGSDGYNNHDHVWVQMVDPIPSREWILHEVDPSECELFDPQDSV